MSNDLISRSVAIDEFYKRVSGDLTIEDIKYIEKVLEEVPTACHVDMIIDKMADIIQKYRSIGTPEEFRNSMKIMRGQSNDRWIPCEEELPETWDIDPDLEPDDIIWPEYIVTIEGASDATALHYNFQEDTWFDDNGNFYRVVAWRPMPTAYHPKRKSVGEDYKQQIMEKFLGKE